MEPSTDEQTTDATDQTVEFVVQEAEDYLRNGNHTQAYEAAGRVAQLEGATQAQQARAALVLAGAALWLGAAPEAHQWLAEAQRLGASFEALATVRGDLRRFDAAQDAIGDGLDTESEFRVVLTSARDALNDGAPEQAEVLLRRLWETVGADEATLQEGGYLLAKALLALGHGDEAHQWADWVVAQGYDGGAELLAEIEEFRAAQQLVTRGVGHADAKDTFFAAQAAYARMDYTSALEIYTAVLNSPGLRPVSRASLAFNVAQCHRRMGDLDLARSWFEEYLRLHPSSEYAAEVRGNLDRLETLAALDDVLLADD